MTDDTQHPCPGKWHWWATTDEEHYTTGPEATREAIIEAAKSDELGLEQDEAGVWHLTFLIAECQENYVDLAAWFDVKHWLEEIGEQLDDNTCGSDDNGDNHPLEEVSKEQQVDLEARVRATIRQWQREHGLKLRSYWFANVRHEETINLTLEEDV